MILTRNGVTTERRIVRLYGRVFVVRLHLDGTPRVILERKGRDGALCDQTYWHCRHRLPGPNSVVRSVLDAAGASYGHLIEREEMAA